MKKIAVLGAGMVGRTIALDLAKKYRVTSMDMNPENLNSLSRLNAHIETQECNILETIQEKNRLSIYDAFVVAVPGFMGFEVLQQLIPIGKPIVDISFFNEDARQLQNLALQYHVPVIVDCGVAPGLSNIILGHLNSIMQLESFACYVGGLPKQRTLPFEYKAPFSPIDVIEEYTRPARLMENGTIVTKPALSEIEWIEIEHVGTLEAFNTDGLRSILHTMPHIPNMKEKTMRYPGHAQLMQGFMRSGFFSNKTIMINDHPIIPAHFTAKLLFDQWKLLPGEQEFTAMLIVATGIRNNRPTKAIFKLYDETEASTQLSSMSRTTGYTCTAAVDLVLHQSINPGIIFPEKLGEQEMYYQSIMEHITNRNIRCSIDFQNL